MPWIDLSQVITAVVIGAASALVTLWISLRRFRTERWWERKAEAYSDIMGHLVEVRLYLEDWLRDTYGEISLKEERRKELSQRSGEAWNELRKTAGMGAFLISEKAADVLKKLLSREGGGFADMVLYIEGELADVDKSIEAIRVEARSDLYTSRRWWGFFG